METRPLDRGGIAIRTAHGWIQMGAPSETIKDSLLTINEVPQIYIVPKYIFSLNQNTSFVDLEFPFFFNFFIKKRKTYVICTEKQKERIKIICQEAMFGPQSFDPAQDFTNNVGPFDINKEMLFFRKHPTEDRLIEISDFVEFFILEEGKTFQVNNIGFNLRQDTIVINDGIETQEVDYNLDFPKWEEVIYKGDPFTPPVFGITTLGASHGFDPVGLTSGFIIWINRRGILVDPPVGTARWMREGGLNPRLISDVIVTHCHSDHDSGIAQKILDEGRIRLYTTKTIFDSYIRKFSAMTGLDTNFLSNVIHYHRIYLGKPMIIGGAKFSFRSTLHSIPTVGFEVEFKNRKFVYSSDHYFNPPEWKKLLDSGVITQERYDYFYSFPWDSDIIFHEAGIPPIHTPINLLENLDQEIKRKIYIFHISDKDIPADSKLHRTPLGLQNTLEIPVESSPVAEIGHLLFILEGIDFLKNFSINQMAQFCFLGLLKNFEAGNYLIKQGEVGEAFYIIISGFADIHHNGVFIKQITSGDFFGEASILLNQNTTADVKATTKVTALVIPGEDFKVYFQGTDLENSLKHLAHIRETDSWKVIENSELFNNFTASLKTNFESRLQLMKYDSYSLVQKQGETYRQAGLISKGKVGVYDGESLVGAIHPGKMFGRIKDIIMQNGAPYSLKTLEPTEIYAITVKDLLEFIKLYPAFNIRMLFQIKY